MRYSVFRLLKPKEPEGKASKFEGQLQQLIQLRENILKSKDNEREPEVEPEIKIEFIPKRHKRTEFELETIKVLY